MTKARTLSNGLRLEFPDTTPDEVVDRVAKEREATLGSTPHTLSPASEPSPPGQDSSVAGPGLTAPGSRPEDMPSALRLLTRGALGVGAGAVLDRALPAAELATRASNAMELTGVEPVRAVQDTSRGLEERYAALRGRMGGSGFDTARMVGAGATDWALTRGVFKGLGKPHLADPRTLPNLAKTGAIAGGIGGLTGPVAESETRSNSDYALQKVIQATTGAGLGATVTPLFAYGIEKGMNLSDKFLRWAAQKLGRNAAQRSAADPAALEVFLEAQAARTGVAWRTLPEDVKQSLREATVRATQATGEMPEEAVRNRLLAEKLNLPQLTRGQATRNPVEFSREANNPDPELRALVNAQGTQATQKLQNLGLGYGPTRTPAEHGSVIIDDLAAQRLARTKTINNLYNVARESEGRHAMIQNINEWARATELELRKQGLIHGAKGLKTAHTDTYNALTALSRPGSNLKMTVEQAVDALQSINKKLSGDPMDPALNTLKSRLQKFLDTPAEEGGAVFRSQDVGTAAVAKFDEARQARADMGRWEDSAWAIKNLASKNPIDTEKVFARTVLASRTDEFPAYWKTLSPESQAATRRMFVDHVQNLALGRTGTDVSNYGRALEFLRKFPREKLRLIFPDGDMGDIALVLEYARLTREAPPGSFVNRSNTSQALLDFATRLHGVPSFIGAPSRAIRGVSDTMQAQNAMGGALFSEEDVPRIIGDEARRLLTRNAAPYAAWPAAVAGLRWNDRRRDGQDSD